MNNWGGWMYRFMQGRRGLDQLGRALFILICILIFARIFLRSRILKYVIWALFFYQIYRMMSRNIPARERENQWFLNLKYGRKNKSAKKKKSKKGSKEPVYRYFICPECGLKMRAPAGTGRIKVKCSRCGREFETLV